MEQTALQMYFRLVFTGSACGSSWDMIGVAVGEALYSEGRALRAKGWLNYGHRGTKRAMCMLGEVSCNS